MIRSGLRVGAMLLCLSAACVTGGLVACGEDDDTLPTNNPTLEEFTVSLNGANERPSTVTTPGNGTVALSFTGSGAITYTVNVVALSSTPTFAHIHGPADANGTANPIVSFTPISNIPTGVLATGTISQTDVPAISLDSLKSLLRNGNSYVNVHTTNFPNGEIRGQVAKK